METISYKELIQLIKELESHISDWRDDDNHEAGPRLDNLHRAVSEFLTESGERD